MKAIATLALAAGLLAAGTPASAQTTFHLGLRGGLNRALTTESQAGNFTSNQGFIYSASKSALYAWQAGLVAEITSGKLAFQPALLFSQKGEELHTTAALIDMAGNYVIGASRTNRYNWLELPLNFVYTLHGDHGLQLFAGPYLALAVSGRQWGTSYFSGPNTQVPPQDFSTTLPYGTDAPNRRFDAGFNFGVGYRQGPVQMQLGYGLGLRNLHQYAGVVNSDYGHNFQGDAAQNRVTQLTGTYFFGW